MLEGLLLKLQLNSIYARTTWHFTWPDICALQAHQNRSFVKQSIFFCFFSWISKLLCFQKQNHLIFPERKKVTDGRWPMGVLLSGKKKKSSLFIHYLFWQKAFFKTFFAVRFSTLCSGFPKKVSERIFNSLVSGPGALKPIISFFQYRLCSLES